eukprot:3627357-Lingulodinium_polyedra.AAC.1
MPGSPGRGNTPRTGENPGPAKWKGPPPRRGPGKTTRTLCIHLGAQGPPQELRKRLQDRPAALACPPRPPEPECASALSGSAALSTRTGARSRPAHRAAEEEEARNSCAGRSPKHGHTRGSH